MVSECREAGLIGLVHCAAHIDHHVPHCQLLCTSALPALLRICVFVAPTSGFWTVCTDVKDGLIVKVPAQGLAWLQVNIIMRMISTKQCSVSAVYSWIAVML